MWASLGRECSKPLGALWRYYPFDQLLERDESFPEGFFVGNKMLTQEFVKSIFDYDSSTGVFTRKTSVASNARKGDVVGWKTSHGYRCTKIKGKSYLLHRIAWLYTYGNLPEETIDHINRRRDDNRISNLRICKFEENLQNKSFYKNNTSGFKGVAKKRNRYVAQITALGKVHHLGYFDDPKDAHETYCIAAKELHTHNEYANTKAKA